MNTSVTQVDALPFDVPVRAPARAEATAPLMKPDWSQGLTLQPHHFQAQDRYHEDLVRFALRAMFEDAWGICDLSIDEHALTSGRLSVSRLRAILPDGTPVIAGTSGADEIPARYFDRKLRGRSHLDVYVGLPLERAGRAAIAPTDADASARFVQERATVHDFNTGASPLPVPWARPSLRILFEDEPLDAFSLLRVGRLSIAHGRVQLDPGFIPPVLRVHASIALEACLRSLEKDVLATLTALGDVRASTAEMTGADAARLLLAGTLGRLLPALQDLHASDSAHPRKAYEVVAALLGGLSAFAAAGRARVPAYDFLELQATFDGLAQATREILDALSAPRQRNIPLERCDENFWRAQLREPGIFGREFLLVLAGGDPATLHASVPRAAKVAALDEISDFVQRHLTGVTLVPEIRRPRGISLPPQAACFRLDKRSPAWSGIVKQGAIALWLPAGFAQLGPMLLAQEPGLLAG